MLQLEMVQKREYHQVGQVVSTKLFTSFAKKLITTFTNPMDQISIHTENFLTSALQLW